MFKSFYKTKSVPNNESCLQALLPPLTQIQVRDLRVYFVSISETPELLVSTTQGLIFFPE